MLDPATCTTDVLKQLHKYQGSFKNPISITSCNDGHNKYGILSLIKDPLLIFNFLPLWRTQKDIEPKSKINLSLIKSLPSGTENLTTC